MTLVKKVIQDNFQLLVHALLYVLPYISLLTTSSPSQGQDGEKELRWRGLGPWICVAGYLATYCICCSIHTSTLSVLSRSPSPSTLTNTLSALAKFTLLSSGPLISVALDEQIVKDEGAKGCIGTFTLLLSIVQANFLYPQGIFGSVFPIGVFLAKSWTIMAALRGSQRGIFAAVGVLASLALVYVYVCGIVHVFRQKSSKIIALLDAMPVGHFLVKKGCAVPANEPAKSIVCSSGFADATELLNNAIIKKSKRILMDSAIEFMACNQKKSISTELAEIISRDKDSRKFYNLQIYRISNSGTAGVSLAESKGSNGVDQIFRTALICSLSHELFTPLNALLPTIARLQEKYKNEEDNALAIASSNAELMWSKAQDLVDFTKLEMGELDHELRSFELSTLFDELLRIFKYEAESKGNKLTFMIISKNPVQMMADYKRIKQILVKLITNAVKYTKDGLIQVSALAKQSSLDVLFKVQDSGIGMTQKQVKSLFSPLSRKSSLLNSPYGGRRLAGIGMTIAEKLCQSLGSHLQVESEEKKGSAISFNIENCRCVCGWIAQDRDEKSPKKTRKNSTTKSSRKYSITPFRNAKKRSISKSKEIGYLIGDDISGSKRKTVKFNELDDWVDWEIPQEYAGLSQMQSVIRTNHYRGKMEAPRVPSRMLLSNVDVLKQCGMANFPSTQLRMQRYVSQEKYATEGNMPESSQKSPSPRLLIDHSPDTRTDPRKCPLISLKMENKQMQPRVDSWSPIEISEPEEEKVPAYCVLIVDDVAGNRYVLKDMMERLGVVVKEATDGEEAYEMVKTSFERETFPKIALIFMDLDMPRLDGVQATRKIRNLEYMMKRELEIPILAVTAFDNDVERQACVEARMQSFITKPVSFSKIKEILHEYINQL